jgi:phosphopantetheinyl transferase
LLAVKKIDSFSFTDNEIKQVLVANKIKSKKRALEILCTRILLMQIGEKGEISYNTNGAPKLSNNKYISISHSSEIVSIILSNNKCGIDIEKISNRAIQAYNRFEAETNFIEENPDFATLIWSAKECIFKLKQKENINFKEDVKTSDINLEKNKICMLFKGGKIILDFLKINNHFLVYFCS